MEEEGVLAKRSSGLGAAHIGNMISKEIYDVLVKTSPT